MAKDIDLFSKRNWFMGLLSLSVILISLVAISSLVQQKTKVGASAGGGGKIVIVGFGPSGFPGSEWNTMGKLVRVLRPRVSVGGLSQAVYFNSAGLPRRTYYYDYSDSTPVGVGKAYYLIYTTGPGNPLSSLKSQASPSSITYNFSITGSVNYGNPMSVPEGVRSRLARKYYARDLCSEIDSQSQEGNTMKIGQVPPRGVKGDINLFRSGLLPEHLDYFDCETSSGVNFSIDVGSAYFVYVNQASSLILPN